jgi:hypothetical protein
LRRSEPRRKQTDSGVGNASHVSQEAVDRIELIGDSEGIQARENRRIDPDFRGDLPD